MNYAYNIRVNLKDKLLSFYEWEKTDKITYLNKVNVYYVNDNIYDDILNMRIKVDNDFLKYLKDGICIFNNDIDMVCVKFNKDGIIKQISKLDLEEEFELFNELSLKKKYDLKYKKINNTNNYSYSTREEEKIINTLLDYINSKKDDKELIDYLYFEWFKNNKCNNKYKKLINSIKQNYSLNHEELYKVIKILV